MRRIAGGVGAREGSDEVDHGLRRAGSHRGSLAIIGSQKHVSPEALSANRPDGRADCNT